MKEIDPTQTTRAMSYEAFINAPMPMVTVFKTLDVTKLCRMSKKGYKFNMLMCLCIVNAAKKIPEFSILPVDKKLYKYDNIGVNVIVANKDGGINSCDIPFDKDLEKFSRSYLELTNSVYEKCENYEIQDSMIVGTSNLAKFGIDGVVNMYSGIFNNPFLIWGRYESRFLKRTLKVSFQFHHVQMDGEHACHFLDLIQENINNIK